MRFLVKNYRLLFDIFTERERKQFYLILVFLSLTGVVEMVGVASILPFLGVLSDPTVIYTNPILSLIYKKLTFSSEQSFLAFLGCSTFGAILFAQGSKALTAYALSRFGIMSTYSLSMRLFQGYLAQPYEWFLSRNSSELSKMIQSETTEIGLCVVLPSLQLLSQGVLSIAIIVVLLYIEPEASLLAVGLILGSYAMITIAVRNRLERIGKERLQANKDRYEIVDQAFGAIKQVKLQALEDYNLDRFRQPAYVYARSQLESSVISQIPRYALEAIAFGGGVALVVFLVIKEQGQISSVIPGIGLFAFAGIRLMPVVQAIYKAIATLKFGAPALEKIYQELQAEDESRSNLDKENLNNWALIKNISLKEVNYSYPNSKKPTLCDFSLNIEANTTVGIIGATGAGKTTTVDIILGLLHPGSGQLSVNSVPIQQLNVRQWQRKLGYVPQDIYLTDDSLARNIAYGVLDDEIDYTALHKAADIAELTDFIEGELPDGFDTFVGDRGVRLSGGQRQRIGIARALYRDPPVLVFDEATSSLDTGTESAVMGALKKLSGQKTIIIIAHRLTTLGNCDRVFLIENGKVAESGKLDELQASLPSSTGEKG